MALTIKSPTETLIIKPSSSSNKSVALGVDSDGSNIKLGSDYVSAEIDTYNSYLRIYSVYNGNNTRLQFMPRLQLEKKITVTASTNQLMIHNPNSTPDWEAGVWIDSEGANLALHNTAGTFETQFDMLNNQGRWYRQYLSGTSYYNDIILRDADIYFGTNTAINGNVYATNVQAKTEIRQFASNGNDLIPDQQPSGGYLSCIGTGEVDFNTMSVRIKVCIWAHGGGSWSTTNPRLCRPVQFLNLLGLSTNYEVDTTRILNGRSYSSGQNFYQLGHARWNAIAQGGEYEVFGPYLAYISEDNGWIVTARIYQNTWSGLSPEAQINATALGSWEQSVVVAGGGITADFILPIKAK